MFYIGGIVSKTNDVEGVLKAAPSMFRVIEHQSLESGGKRVSSMGDRKDKNVALLWAESLTLQNDLGNPEGDRTKAADYEVRDDQGNLVK